MGREKQRRRGGKVLFEKRKKGIIYMELKIPHWFLVEIINDKNHTQNMLFMKQCLS